MYIFIIFTFSILISVQIYLYSYEESLIFHHGSLFIDKKPVIVTEATENDINDLNKLITSVYSLDPSRRLQIYVQKEKNEWWKIYENLVNVEVIDLKTIKTEDKKDFKIFIFSILLKALEENEYAIFIHPKFKIMESLNNLDALLYQNGHFLLTDFHQPNECFLGVQGYARNSLAFQYLKSSNDDQLKNPSAKKFSSYLVSVGNTNSKNGRYLENLNSLRCNSASIMFFPMNNKYELISRTKLKKIKKQKKKIGIIRSRVAILFGTVRDRFQARKTVDHLIQSIVSFKGQISFFAYFSSQKKSEIVAQTLKNNVIPIKSIMYSASFVYQINMQAEKAMEDGCEYFCVLFKMDQKLKVEWKEKLKEKDGFGVYLSDDFICVSNTHYEIFGTIFPNSFKFFFFDSLKFYLKEIYKSFNGVSGIFNENRRMFPLAEILLEKEIKQGLEKIKNYKKNHLV
eukprot:gene8309-133_t